MVVFLGDIGHEEPHLLPSSQISSCLRPGLYGEHNRESPHKKLFGNVLEAPLSQNRTLSSHVLSFGQFLDRRFGLIDPWSPVELV